MLLVWQEPIKKEGVKTNRPDAELIYIPFDETLKKAGCSAETIKNYLHKAQKKRWNTSSFF